MTCLQGSADTEFVSLDNWTWLSFDQLKDWAWCYGGYALLIIVCDMDTDTKQLSLCLTVEYYNVCASVSVNVTNHETV